MAADKPARKVPTRKRAATKTARNRVVKKTTAKKPLKKAVKKTATTKRAAGRRSTPKQPDLSQSYAEAKQAVGKLWDEVAKDAHVRFNSISKKVEQRFRDTQKNIRDIDVQYAIDKAGVVAESMMKSAKSWVKMLGMQVKLLWEMLKDVWSHEFTAPWGTVAAITAALLYVVMPFDVIPDFIPGIGLVDDMFVITMCVSLIRIDLRRYAKFRKLSLTDYGL